MSGPGGGGVCAETTVKAKTGQKARVRRESIGNQKLRVKKGNWLGRVALYGMEVQHFRPLTAVLRDEDFNAV